MDLIGLLDHLPMVGQGRHAVDRPRTIGVAKRNIWPIRLEAEFAVRPVEAAQVMRRLEVGLAVDPTIGLELRERAPSGFLQGPVDQLARAHGEARMTRAETTRQCGDYLMVRSAFARRLH